MKSFIHSDFIEKTLSCSSTELRVFISLMDICKHNLIDLEKKESKDRLVELLNGLSDSSINNALTGLRKKKLLIKSRVPKVWFINPNVVMKGYYKKIYELLDMIKIGNAGGLIEMFKKIDNGDIEREDRIERQREIEFRKMSEEWERRRKIQNEDFSEMERIVDEMTDKEYSYDSK